MTGNTERCEYYKRESQNVKDRYFCQPPPGYKEYLDTQNDRRHRGNNKNKYIPITEEECKVSGVGC